MWTPFRNNLRHFTAMAALQSTSSVSVSQVQFHYSDLLRFDSSSFPVASSDPTRGKTAELFRSAIPHVTSRTASPRQKPDPETKLGSRPNHIKPTLDLDLLSRSLWLPGWRAHARSQAQKPNLGTVRSRLLGHRRPSQIFSCGLWSLKLWDVWLEAVDV